MNNIHMATNKINEYRDEEMDLKEIWRILRSNVMVISVIFFLAIMITIYATITTRPLFEATTVVLLKENTANASSFVFDFGLSGSQHRIKNEIEVLNSYNLHDQVVQSLIEDGSANELDLFGTKYTRYRYRLKDYFRTRFIPPSDSMISPRDLTFKQRIGIVGKLRGSCEIKTVRDTDVLKLAVTSTDSSEAIFLANRISTIYQNLDLAGGQGELHFVFSFLDTQITKYERRLALVEEELRQFQTANKIYALDGAAELLLRDLTQYESIYYTNIAELEVSQQRVKYLESQLNDSEQALIDEITNTNNPMIVALRGKIAELEAQKVQQMVDEG